MQMSDRIGSRMKLQDLHVLMTVVQAGSMGKAALVLEYHPAQRFESNRRILSMRSASACSTATSGELSRPSAAAPC